MATALPPNIARIHAAASEPSRVDSERYIAQDFLDRELDQVFGRAWLVACTAHELEQAGDFRVLDALGESVIVLRGEDDSIRAFHNSCRHRGSRLLDGRGRKQAIACPYHGWTYGLDGDLCKVPRAEGFECLDTSERGLRPVRVELFAGFVWLNFDDEAPPLHGTLAGLPEELAPYRLEEMRPIQSFERELPCNWKVVLENAMDLYHVPVVHSRSVSRYVDTQPELTKLGDHSRQRIQIARYGWRQRLDEACSRGGPYTPLQRSAMHKYFVFPNFLINVLPFHLTVMQVFPIDPTSCLLRYSFCRRKGARGLELARALATWLASRWILREDLGILQRFQDGVATGRVSEQLFHEGEGAGAHLHGALDRWLAASPR